MSQINWDVHEMKDMHNPYVDVLLRVCTVPLILDHSYLVEKFNNFENC